MEDTNALPDENILNDPEKAFPPEGGSHGAHQSRAVTCCSGLNPLLYTFLWRKVGESHRNQQSDVYQKVICHYTLKRLLVSDS